MKKRIENILEKGKSFDNLDKTLYVVNMNKQTKIRASNVCNKEFNPINNLNNLINFNPKFSKMNFNDKDKLNLIQFNQCKITINLVFNKSKKR